jgi:outer membrane immunogenic protein
MLHAGDGVRSSLEVGCLFITPGADMKNVLFACAFGGVLASGAAMSAERTPNPALHKAAPNRLYSWEGLYLGANAGYGSGSDSRLDPGASGAQTGAFLDGPAQLAAQLAGLASLGLNTKGSLGGGQSGYNWQVGALVWGIETDFDGTHISGSVARNSNNPVTGFPPFSVQTNISGSQSLETFGTFRGRIGWTPFDRNLIYATGGLAYGHASSSVGISQIEVLGDTFTSSSGMAAKTLPGWTIGGGWEWAFAVNWSIKTEYLYYDLGTLHYTANPIFGIAFMGPPFTLTTFNPSTEFKGSIFRVGLNWRLGGAG